MRSQAEIKAEIEKLKSMKPNVRRISGFGDNHHDAIDAQIRVLSGEVSCDEFDDEFEDTRDNVRDSAQQALDWMDGSINEVPSDEWESLLQ